jgi:tetratricopeptide (TPR) repeat protein
MNNYRVPKTVRDNQAELDFWKNRIVPNSVDYSNTSKYTAALIGRFHLLGDINDVKLADSLSLKTASDYRGKEVGPYFSLMGHYILEHRFKDADSILILAKQIGMKKYESAALSFDVDFELGRIAIAKAELNTIADASDYGYQFRESKFMHYKGDLDSSIAAMQKAVVNAGPEERLKVAALSNVGDLYIHAGKLDKAYNCYVECIKINPAEMHSVMGIAWIALVKDKNDSLAEKIFQFVASKTKSPEPFFKLVSVAEQRGDSLLQVKYAKAFEEKAIEPINGNMYNKYLIQLYTGILHTPEKAEVLAKKELLSRATPQTYSWYVWALLNNNKKDEAYRIYQENVSGQPLEGLELYWMGKLMQSLNKGYNAKEYFKGAAINKYDLSPAMVKDLTKSLEE